MLSVQSCSHVCHKEWWHLDKEGGTSWPHCHQSPHRKSCLCLQMKPKASNCHVKLLSIHQQLLIRKETKRLISSGQLGTLQRITNRLVMMVLTKKDEACFLSLLIISICSESDSHQTGIWGGKNMAYFDLIRLCWQFLAQTKQTWSIITS